MLIPIERLIDGCLHTLREEVLPEVASRAVRGRVWAVLDVLHNLRDRIEESRAPAETEAESAADALRRLAAARREGADPEGAARLEQALAAAPEGPPGARAAALRAALADAIAARPEGLAPPERDALRAHLAAQSLRDLAPLKPSLLAEISKG
ncbi:MAG: hypothetical protein ACHQ3O_05655 [Candidatus Limnocylindria bacterium]